MQDPRALSAAVVNEVVARNVMVDYASIVKYMRTKCVSSMRTEEC